MAVDNGSRSQIQGDRQQMKRAPENIGALIAEVKKLTVRRSVYRDNWAALVELT
jgi:hypothetical protein